MKKVKILVAKTMREMEEYINKYFMLGYTLVGAVVPFERDGCFSIMATMVKYD